MRRCLPVISRLRAKLHGRSTLAQCAAEVIELAPAVTRAQTAAIALPGESERVLATLEESTPALELGRLSEGEWTHGPTIAYRIDNAVLDAGTLYYENGYDVIRSRSSRALLPRNLDEFAEMQLCANYVIDRYFGHWLFDGLCLELLAEERSLPALTSDRPPWKHEPEYRELSGLKELRSRNAHVDRLWVIDDRGLNGSFISRVEQLRARLRSGPAQNGAKRVMLTRGVLGAKRNLVNSIEVHEALMRLGFDVINPETETAHSIVRKLSEAEIAIAVEGSAQSHCWLTMPYRSTFIAIQPPARFNALGKARADATGINWAYVVANAHPDGFFLPVDRLLRTIDEVMRVTTMRGQNVGAVATREGLKLVQARHPCNREPEINTLR